MPYRTLQVSQTDDIVTITLNRPEKRNSITTEMMEELTAIFLELAVSSCRTVILTGTGKAFCAGMDLEELKALAGLSPEQNQRDAQRLASMYRAVYESPVPTIAAVNGAAIAGGAGLAALCDLTLAVPQAKLGFPEVRIGFIPAVVSCFLLSQLGDKRTRDLLLTGRLLEAEEALRLGLVTEIVPEDRLIQRAHELAATLAENSPAALRVTRRLLGGFVEPDIERRLAMAVSESAAIRRTPEFVEGVSAFLEKRKPVWPG